MKVDFMFRLARNFYVGPMAVFDYVYGHGLKTGTVGRHEHAYYESKCRFIVAL